MARVIFSAEYEIKSDKVKNYLEKVSKLKIILNGLGYDYHLYRDKKKTNIFYEMFIFPSVEEFDKFDDVPSDEANDIIYEITSNFVENKKVLYKTMVEEL